MKKLASYKIWAQVAVLGAVAAAVLLMPEVAWAQELDAAPLKKHFKTGRVFMVVIALGILGFTVIDVAMKVFQEEHGIKGRIYGCIKAIALLIFLERGLAWIEGAVTSGG